MDGSAREILTVHLILSCAVSLLLLPLLADLKLVQLKLHLILQHL